MSKVTHLLVYVCIVLTPCFVLLVQLALVHLKIWLCLASDWCRFPSRRLAYTSICLSMSNWMAWCKRDVSDFFRWNFFSFKKCLNFCMTCAFQLSSTTFLCIIFAWFALCFWEKEKTKYWSVHNEHNKAELVRAFQPEKWYRRMFFYLIENHMQKFRHFWRKKNFTWKSHLRPSCTTSHSTFFLRSMFVFVPLFVDFVHYLTSGTTRFKYRFSCISH